MTRVISTGLAFVKSMTLLGDGIVVICGSESRTTRIKSYNLQTGAELNWLYVDDARGLAEVKLDQKLVLAVSFK